MDLSLELTINAVSAEIAERGNNKKIFRTAVDTFGLDRTEDIMEDVIVHYREKSTAEVYRLEIFGNTYSTLIAGAENGDKEAGITAELMYETKQACERLTAPIRHQPKP